MRKLYGIGTGPGASDLLTVRAVNVLESADMIFAPNNKGKNMALDTCKPYIKTKRIVMIDFPMGNVTEKHYIDAMELIHEEIGENQIGAFLNIGDSTIYSTFMNMVLTNLKEDMEVELVPGIPSFVGAANAVKRNLTLKGENFLLCDEPSEEILNSVESVAILKTFKEKQETLEMLENNGFNYVYVSNASQENQKVLYEKEEILSEENYISLILARREELTKELD
ncbi:MAG: precorrin-2 C(20)-methyltransferase [Tissierellia bacterium]|nr:precorrin-2 C(20)-methyltransferase [Tissierellia bacterium]